MVPLGSSAENPPPKSWDNIQDPMVDLGSSAENPPPKSWDNIQDPMVSLERNLFGHPEQDCFGDDNLRRYRSQMFGKQFQTVNVCSCTAKPPGFAKYSATIESALAVSPNEAGSFWVQSRWHDQSCRSAQDLVPGKGRGRQKYPSGAKL